MTKLYCITLNFGDMEDVLMTLNLDLALDRIKNSKGRRTILGYDVTENGIAEYWSEIWYIGEDGNLVHENVGSD